MTLTDTLTAPTCDECPTEMTRAGGAGLYWTCRHCGTTVPFGA